MPTSILLPNQKLETLTKWGDVFGEMSDQSDLTHALNDKSDINHNHINLYEPKNINIQQHISSIANPHSVTKEQIGLGNLTNDTQIAKSLGTAKGDIIIYQGANLPANLQVGTNGQCIVADSTQPFGLKWVTLNNSAEILTPASLTNCENTTSYVSLINLAIPGNTISDKDFVDIQFYIELLQNYGSNVSVYRSIYINQLQVVEFVTSVANNNAPSRFYYGAIMQRLGNDLLVSGHYPSKTGTGYYEHAAVTMQTMPAPADLFSAGYGGTVSNLDFSSNIVLEIKWKFSNASPMVYARPKVAKIMKIKGS